MSPEMKKLHLENQVTQATVYNSFNLPKASNQLRGPECSTELEKNTDCKFEETAIMKEMSPQCQGNDAALEQLIKRSKKGAKIQVKNWKRNFV